MGWGDHAQHKQMKGCIAVGSVLKQSEAERQGKDCWPPLPGYDKSQPSLIRTTEQLLGFLS